MKKYRGLRYYATETRKGGWVVIDREKTRLQDDVIEKFGTRKKARDKANELNRTAVPVTT